MTTAATITLPGTKRIRKYRKQEQPKRQICLERYEHKWRMHIHKAEFVCIHICCSIRPVNASTYEYLLFQSNWIQDYASELLMQAISTRPKSNNYTRNVHCEIYSHKWFVWRIRWIYKYIAADLKLFLFNSSYNVLCMFFTWFLYANTS